MRVNELLSGAWRRIGVGAGAILTLAPERALAADAPQQAQTPAAEPAGAVTLTVKPPTLRLNTSGQTLPLSAPLLVNGLEVGTVDLLIDPNDIVRVDSSSLAKALTPQLTMTRSAAVALSLASLKTPTIDEIRAGGLDARFDLESLSLLITAQPSDLPIRSLAIIDALPKSEVSLQPGAVSAYANVFAAVERRSDISGQPLSLSIDGAARARGIVVEMQGRAALGGDDDRVVREATRLVYDDVRRTQRWVMGDLVVERAGFQSSAPMLGLSVSRVYARLDPGRNIFQRGRQSFTLDRPSTVEAFINGQRIRTFDLGPGSYELSDFPFLVGRNDVVLEARDSTGRVSRTSFDVFYDRRMLGADVREYGMYVGFAARSSFQGLTYAYDRPQATAFWRAGLNDRMTVSAGIQGDAQAQQAFVGALRPTPLGLVGVDLGVSSLANGGAGGALNAVVQSSFGQGARRTSVWGGLDLRTSNFASLGDEGDPDNRSVEVYAGYGRPIGRSTFMSLNARYGAATRAEPEQVDAKIALSRPIGARFSATLEAGVETTLGRTEGGVRFSLARKFGKRTEGRILHDSFRSRNVVDLRTFGGDAVGAWSASAEVDAGPIETLASANATYAANRGELAIDHIAAIETDDGNASATSMQVRSSIAWVDGAFGIGRPIADAFAIAAPHPSLESSVRIDVRENSFEGKSGIFGGAVAPNVSAYVDRTISYIAPDAPMGYDIGPGAHLIRAPYRAGYKIEVGSDYAVTAVGRLLKPDGAPVSLLVGTAIDLQAPDRAPVTIFTNRDGVFGASGLREGSWRIEMPTIPRSVATIQVRKTNGNVATIGDVTMVEQGARK